MVSSRQAAAAQVVQRGARPRAGSRRRRKAASAAASTPCRSRARAAPAPPPAGVGFGTSIPASAASRSTASGKAGALGAHDEGDGVAMRAAAEAVEVVVVDVEGGRLLVVEGAAALPLPADCAAAASAARSAAPAACGREARRGSRGGGPWRARLHCHPRPCSASAPSGTPARMDGRRAPAQPRRKPSISRSAQARTPFIGSRFCTRRAIIFAWMPWLNICTATP